MKKWLLAAALIGVVVAGLMSLRNSGRKPGLPMDEASPASPASAKSADSISAVAAPDHTAAASTAPPTAAAIPQTPPENAGSPAMAAAIPSTATNSTEQTPVDLPPATVLENMRTTIRLYGSMFGGNPVGTNPEITSALNGHNPKQVQFIRPEAGMRINGSGELVDPWGTPYFFHQLSGTEMEIHSAGPDRKMWTPDDLVTK